MQYIDFCCKKTTREHIVLRIKNSVILCNQLTTVLFSLASLVEQHPSKLVLHSLAGALIKRDSVEPLIISVIPCVIKKSGSSDILSDNIHFISYP